MCEGVVLFWYLKLLPLATMDTYYPWFQTDYTNMYTYILNSYYYSSYVFKCLCMYVCIYTQTPFLINITQAHNNHFNNLNFTCYCSVRGRELVRRKKNYKHPWKHRYQHDSGGSYSLSVGSNSYYSAEGLTELEGVRE